MFLNIFFLPYYFLVPNIELIFADFNFPKILFYINYKEKSPMIPYLNLKNKKIKNENLFINNHIYLHKFQNI